MEKMIDKEIALLNDYLEAYQAGDLKDETGETILDLRARLSCLHHPIEHKKYGETWGFLSTEGE